MTNRTNRLVHAVGAALALLFGALTIFAGDRVLLGADAGYGVFQPLLVYNTIVGLVYVAAGLIAWRSLRAGRNAAAVAVSAALACIGRASR